MMTTTTRRVFLGSLAARRPPNIVTILADDMGYGDLGCYGGPIATPALDALAASGLRFTQAYVAAPICSPSRVGITTGQCPARHGIFSYLNDRASQRRLGMKDWLDPAAPSLARVLKSAGYATVHCGKWHMGGGRDVGDAPLPAEYGFDDSLTSFEGLGDRVLPPGRLSDQSAALGRGKIRRVQQHELTGLFVDRALEFIDGHRGRPFFLQLWPNDVHDPFVPEPELLKKHAARFANKYEAQYFAMLEGMDREIGRLVARLEAMGEAENTVFVFMSDNGPTAWPRYYAEGLRPPGSTSGLRGRKWSLYEGGIRVPLMVSWKGRVPAGRVDRSTVVSSLDLFPTLCRWAGARLPGGVAFDGEDMSSAFAGRPKQRKMDLFWEYGRDASYLRPGLKEDQSPNLAMRRGRWKYLVNADGTGGQLYDLRADERESRDVGADNGRLAAEMRGRLLAWRRGLQ